jgi:hypothetical protein
MRLALIVPEVSDCSIKFHSDEIAVWNFDKYTIFVPKLNKLQS